MSSSSPSPRRLVLLCALMLFVELALIRWSGASIVYLSYFSNFILLGSFLGIGIGFLRSGSEKSIWPWAPWALLGMTLFITVFPTTIDRSGSSIIFFGDSTVKGLPIWVALPIIFTLVAFVLATIADGVARTFKEFEPLGAYRLDILGSILGILTFTLLSFFGAPPIVGGVLIAIVFIVLGPKRFGIGTAAPLILIIGLLAGQSFQPETYWSPYYKIQLSDADTGTDTSVKGVAVNGIPHQAIMPNELREALGGKIYSAPYRHSPDNPLDDVLIVGAGTGNDIATALRQGAKHIDAVEIDPRLRDLGRELHPNQPYADPRVNSIINDGRAHLERTDKKYDLIIFALPDSLTLVSGQSSLRLESYLFTLQSLQSARNHLKPDGVFSMYNFYRESWLVGRLDRTLTEAFGHAPCVDELGEEHLAAMTIGWTADSVSCPPQGTSLDISQAPPPATDDYPFLYLKDRSIPSLYLSVLAFILVFSLLLVRSVAGPLKGMRPYLDLFFMGVAFLLLETKSIVQFALLFGTTWVVNSIAFVGILLSVLCAIEVAKRVTLKRPALLYGALLVALAVAFVIPPASLLAFGLGLRIPLAMLLAFTPIFLANLIFAERFKETANSTRAFGANLIGAMVGGCLEYIALVSGYQFLLVMVALLYGAAFLAGRRYLRA